MELQGKKEVTHKKLAHVQVYEALYKMVEVGTFPGWKQITRRTETGKNAGSQ